MDVWVAGEQAPRRFEQADATMRLARGYKRLTVDVTAAVHERDPSTYRCAGFCGNDTEHVPAAIPLSGLRNPGVFW